MPGGISTAISFFVAALRKCLVSYVFYLDILSANVHIKIAKFSFSKYTINRHDKITCVHLFIKIFLLSLLFVSQNNMYARVDFKSKRPELI